ncbi:hypothetical protein CR513_47342, partial [Mucuna pruriens]
CSFFLRYQTTLHVSYSFSLFLGHQTEWKRRVKFFVDLVPSVKPMFIALYKILEGVLVLLVEKKDESMKLCVIYYRLNKVKFKNRYHLPRHLDSLRLVEGKLSCRELEIVTLVDESRFEVFSDHKNLRRSLVKKKKSKMRQHKWLEFLKDYNFDLSHHPSKVNVVVNDLCRESFYSDLRNLSLVCEVTLKSMKFGMLKVTSDLMEECRKDQKLRQLGYSLVS